MHSKVDNINILWIYSHLRQFCSSFYSSRSLDLNLLTCFFHIAILCSCALQLFCRSITTKFRNKKTILMTIARAFIWLSKAKPHREQLQMKSIPTLHLNHAATCWCSPCKWQAFLLRLARSSKTRESQVQAKLNKKLCLGPKNLRLQPEWLKPWISKFLRLMLSFATMVRTTTTCVIDVVVYRVVNINTEPKAYNFSLLLWLSRHVSVRYELTCKCYLKLNNFEHP